MTSIRQMFVVVALVVTGACNGGNGGNPGAPSPTPNPNPGDGPSPQPAQSSVRIISISPASGSEIKTSTCWAVVKVIAEYSIVGNYDGVSGWVMFYSSVDGETLLVGGSGGRAGDRSGQVVSDACIESSVAHKNNIPVTNFIIARLELTTLDNQQVVEVLAQEVKPWVFLWNYDR